MSDAAPRRCFVISPIDQEGSDNRIRADWLLLEVIKPVLEQSPYNYSVMRADEFPEPGMITSQIIGAILEWDLVIADLSGKNANAFYELALRHMAVKPVIHMIEAGETIPFDVSEYRTVWYSLKHPNDLQKARVELKQKLEATLSADYKISNPVTKARGVGQLAKSSDPQSKIIADLTDQVARLETRLSKIDANISRTLPTSDGNNLLRLAALLQGQTDRQRRESEALADALRKPSEHDINSANALRRYLREDK